MHENGLCAQQDKHQDNKSKRVLIAVQCKSLILQMRPFSQNVEPFRQLSPFLGPPFAHRDSVMTSRPKHLTDTDACTFI